MINPVIYEKAKSIASRGEKPYSLSYIPDSIPGGILMQQKERRRQITDAVVLVGECVPDPPIIKNKAMMEIAGGYRRMEMPSFWKDSSNKPMYTIYLQKTQDQAEKEKRDKEWNDNKFKVSGKVGSVYKF